MNCSKTVRPFRLNGEVFRTTKKLFCFISFRKTETIVLYCHILHVHTYTPTCIRNIQTYIRMYDCRAALRNLSKEGEG